MSKTCLPKSKSCTKQNIQSIVWKTYKSHRFIVHLLSSLVRVLIVEKCEKWTSFFSCSVDRRKMTYWILFLSFFFRHSFHQITALFFFFAIMFVDDTLFSFNVTFSSSSNDNINNHVAWQWNSNLERRKKRFQNFSQIVIHHWFCYRQLFSFVLEYFEEKKYFVVGKPVDTPLTHCFYSCAVKCNRNIWHFLFALDRNIFFIRQIFLRISKQHYRFRRRTTEPSGHRENKQKKMANEWKCDVIEMVAFFRVNFRPYESHVKKM